MDEPHGPAQWETSEGRRSLTAKISPLLAGAARFPLHHQAQGAVVAGAFGSKKDETLPFLCAWYPHGFGSSWLEALGTEQKNLWDKWEPEAAALRELTAA